MKQLLMSILYVVVGVYIVVCVALYFLQERLLFLPEVLRPDFRYSFPMRFEEVSLPVRGATIHALRFKPEHPRGAILYLHGNAGSLRSWGAVAADFVRQGYEVFIPDYRGFGKSTGRITSERILHEDARAAYDHLRQHYAEDRIVIYGRSLGTGLAVRLASSAQPKMVILETPYFSMRELAKRQFPFVPAFLLKYPLRTDLWISGVTCPIYLIHGTEDEFIPYDSSVRLLPLIKSKHELVTIRGGGHNNLEHFPEYHAAIARIMEAERPAP